MHSLVLGQNDLLPIFLCYLWWCFKCFFLWCLVFLIIECFGYLDCRYSNFFGRCSILDYLFTYICSLRTCKQDKHRTSTSAGNRTWFHTKWLPRWTTGGYYEVSDRAQVAIEWSSRSLNCLLPFHPRMLLKWRWFWKKIPQWQLCQNGFH